MPPRIYINIAHSEWQCFFIGAIADMTANIWRKILVYEQSFWRHRVGRRPIYQEYVPNVKTVL